MGSSPCDGPAASGRLTPAKVLIAGGCGAGKTTLVTAISEIRPLRTEEPLTRAGTGAGHVSSVDAKTTVTVAMDFGRITLSSHRVLYLFGTPWQERFGFMWDELAYGALGAVVLADTRRLSDCFPSVDYFEKRRLPFILAVNCFDGAPRHGLGDVRAALDLDPHVPALACDPRQRTEARQVLLTLVEHALATALGSRHAE
jgi:uncharacterized protein